MKRAITLSLAISLALCAGHAFAVGLGQIQVKSRLNQPLVAEIPVTVDRGSDAESLVVSLASAEEFSRIGIDRSQIGVPLEFTIGKGSGGQTVIRVTSTEPVHAPFLDFLVAANWRNGRVLREYTVLLDPPGSAPAVATMEEPAAAPARRAVAPMPAAADRAQPTESTRAEPPAAAAPRSAPEPAPVATTAPNSPTSMAASPPPPTRSTAERSPPPLSVNADGESSYGPVESGQTLSEIANSSVRDEGVSANQLMMALLKANPQAFSRNNINRLKSGAILRIPSAEDIRAVGSMSEATAQVRTQIAEWREQKGAPTLLAGTAAANVGGSEPSAKSNSRTRDDRLALVPPELGKDGLASTGQAGSSAGAAAGNASAAELARTNESLASARQEAGDLRSRVSTLEELKTKNDRLISLKDSEIADLQRQLAAVQAEPRQGLAGTAATTGSTENNGVPGDTQSAQPASGAMTPDAANPAGGADSTTPVTTTGDIAPAPPAPVISSPDTQASATTEPVTTPAAGSDAPVVVAEPTASPAVMTDDQEVDDENPWYLDPRILGGAGIILLLLGVLAVRARRKTASLANRPSIADRFSGEIPAGAPFSRAADGAVLIDEEAQLAEHIDDHPDDLGARLELLSIYYADNRVEEFRAGALEMQPYVDDPTEAEWVQVRAMGEDLLPRDPLFSSSAADHADDDDSDDDWTESDDDAVDNPASRWSDSKEDVVETGRPLHESLVAPALDRFDDRSDDAPTVAIDAPNNRLSTTRSDDASEFVGLDDERDRTEVIAPANVDEPDQLFNFELEDAADLDTPALAPRAPQGMDAGERPLSRTLTESEAKPADSFDFDLPPLDFESEFGKPAESESPVDSRSEVRADLDEDRLDLGNNRADLDQEFLIGEDALGTKLDLARAYADMGDPDGARGMLEEVIANGDSEQQKTARKLLAELS